MTTTDTLFELYKLYVKALDTIYHITPGTEGAIRKSRPHWGEQDMTEELVTANTALHLYFLVGCVRIFFDGAGKAHKLNSLRHMALNSTLSKIDEAYEAFKGSEVERFGNEFLFHRQKKAERVEAEELSRRIGELLSLVGLILGEVAEHESRNLEEEYRDFSRICRG